MGSGVCSFHVSPPVGGQLHENADEVHTGLAPVIFPGVNVMAANAVILAASPHADELVRVENIPGRQRS
jgi:hypothetical protein